MLLLRLLSLPYTDLQRSTVSSIYLHHRNLPQPSAPLPLLTDGEGTPSTRWIQADLGDRREGRCNLTLRKEGEPDRRRGRSTDGVEERQRGRSAAAEVEEGGHRGRGKDVVGAVGAVVPRGS